MKNSPSKKNLFKKAFSLALSNIWRNKVLSIATIFVIGIIIFIFNIIIAINFIADDALSNLSKKIDIIVYLKDSTTEKDIEDIAGDIKKLEGVENVVFTSKENALNQIKKNHPDLSLAFEKYSLGNPLPASLNITTTHPEYHKLIADTLAKEKYKPYLSSVVTSSDENSSIITSVSKNLLAVSKFTNQIIFWLITTFIVGGVLIILNALQITIFTRRKEIEVMKLVGASYSFIRMPFIIESIIYGLLAVVVSILMVLLVSQKIQIQEISLLSYYTNTKFLNIFLMEITATILLSALSAYILVHEHLLRK